MPEFKNKVVVITGAARGIGKNIANRFALEGASVIVADSNEAEGLATVTELQKKDFNAEFFKVDLSQVHQIETMMASILHNYSSIDVLINNARGGSRTQALQETENNLQEVFDISVKAPIFASQTMIKALTDTKKEGCILNISSIAAQVICQESAAYHLSKASLENLTRYLAVYGGPFGVRVNAIQPGFIVQDEHLSRFRKSDNQGYRQKAEFCHPLNKVGSSDDIANAALFLCSEQAAFITGQTLTVDGGLTIQDPFSLLMQFQQ